MRWPWSKPRETPSEPLAAELLGRVRELERKLAQVTDEKTVFIGAQPAVTKLPDDWPQTVGTVARHERRLDGLQTQMGLQQQQLTALAEQLAPRPRRRRRG